MSGGRLVVLDRSGRDVKRYPLARGLATLGSGAPCDIRFMLASVSPHHATVVVHNSQTVVRNVGAGATLVNGQSVSVAALRHNDVITIGDRSLRWEYAQPSRRHQVSPGVRARLPAPDRRVAGGRSARRGSGPAAGPPRDRALQLAIEMTHRASMPASSGGKQVAVVQPQRRDTNEQNVPQNTTKASMWIESRKSSPRRRAASASPSPAPPAPAPRAPPARRAMSAKKGTPLRLTVLRKAQSATKMRVIKIEDPTRIDHTKQAAIMLMTGHTPKGRLSLNQSNRSPSYLVKKPSPVRKTPARQSRAGGRRSTQAGDAGAPRRTCSNTRASKRSSGNSSLSIFEITDSSPRSLPARDSSSRAGRSLRASQLPTPRKSALKDLSRKGPRLTESIKFDLSNLESRDDEAASRLHGGDSLSEDDLSEDDLTLHYSASSAQSPSPRRPALAPSPSPSPARTPTPSSPSARRSTRGSLLVRRALSGSRSSQASDRTADTVASAFRTRTLSPRSKAAESFSIVDLVSMDSETSKSVYNSANSTDFSSPGASERNARSMMDAVLLGSSTPYVAPRGSRGTRPARAASIPSARSTRGSPGSRRSKSLSTPENDSAVQAPAPRARGSRSRSRLHDSSLQLLDATAPGDASPRSSRRAAPEAGTSTPEERGSPPAAGTPVLNIQSLLDASRREAERRSRGRRNTVGVLRTSGRRALAASKSLGAARRSVLRLSAEESPRPVRTPRGSVALVQEAVKNQHSTAKKPQSKRSIIDDLDRSDIVKQLFSSPVKRKLSQSMTEFSRRHLGEDGPARRSARHGLTAGGADDDSTSELSGTFTPDRFVSPIATPSPSPNLSGIKRLFARTTPENDLRDVRGVKKLFRVSHTNDLRNVSGVKRTLRNSPRNDLTDVRGVRKLFRQGAREATSHDLSGVEELFNTSGQSLAPSESFFDQLLGKPARRSVYSKTFCAQLIRKPSKRTGTLHNSLDTIDGNVEHWLDRELQRRLDRSKNVSKELQRPCTTPGLRRAASERALPVKKRALAAGGSLERLPLKKRPVVHSTPLKGRAAALLAEELGRVSPIHRDTAQDRTVQLTTSIPESSGRQSKARTSQTPTKLAPKASPRVKATPKVSPRAKTTPKVSAIAEATPIVSPRAKATPKATPRSKNTPKVTPRSKATPKVTPRSTATPTLSPRSKITPKVTPRAKATPQSSPTSKATSRSRSNTTLKNTSVASPRPKTTPKSSSKPKYTPKSSPRLKGASNGTPRRITTPKPSPRLKATPKALSQAKTTPKPSPRSSATPKPSPRPNAASVASPRLKTTPKPLPRSKVTPKPRSKATSENTLSIISPRSITTPNPSPRSRTTPKPSPMSKATSLPSPRSKTTPTVTPRSKATPNITPRSTATPTLSPRSKTTPKVTPKAKSTPQSSSRSKTTPKPSPRSKATPKPSPKSKATPKVTPRKPTLSPKASSQKAEKTPPKRATRNRKNTTVNNTKKRRTSLVITKKTPVISPQVDPKSLETSRASPVKRATRGKKEPKAETPKRTRVRAQKATVVVSKPSPKLKRQAKSKELSQIEQKPKRTRNITALESPKESQAKRARGKQKEPEGKENRTDNVPAEKPKRGRKAAAEVAVEVAAEAPPARRRRGQATQAVLEVKTRGKPVTKAEAVVEKQPRGRAKKAEPVANVASEPTTRRGRKNTANVSLEVKPKTRGKKLETQSSVQSEPPTRGRRTKAADTAEVPAKKGRKRKSAPIEAVPPKVAKTETRRGKKEAVEPVKPAASKATARTTKDKDETPQKTKTRGKKAEVKKPAAKTTRGKKVPEPKESPVADKRKRKAKVEASPVKGKKPSPSEAKQPRAGEPAPRAARATRATRARAEPEEKAGRGRSARR